MDITIVSDSLFSTSPSALAKALHSNGHNVNMVLPFYEYELQKQRSKLNSLGSFNMNMPFGCIRITLLHSYIEGISCFFIANTYYFEKLQKRSAYDEAEAISVFCHAVLELFNYTQYFPQYIFTDSHKTAFIPALLKLKYRYIDGYESIKTFHYINENKYGIYNRAFSYSVFGIDKDAAHILTSSNEINLTRAAIICSSRIFLGENAASILYDKNSSIHHAALQFGFKLRKLRMGIDYSLFDPERDPEIQKNYSSAALCDKLQNKLLIQRHYGLKQDENIPLITVYPCRVKEISQRIIKEISRGDVQMIILNLNSPQSRISKPEHSCISQKTVFEETLDILSLKNLFSASDIAVFGGFESPYGNPSFIASAYGCVPVIPTQRYFDLGISYFNKITLEGNGYTYDMHIPKDIIYTLWDALGVYRHDKKTFNKLMQICMKKDFSVNSALKAIEQETEKSPYYQN
ncbi:MAG: glycogen synthase [Ruminococcaceae bacterium]|nr:glycogen synthase [Oscillospiraceae bacterium]